MNAFDRADSAFVTQATHPASRHAAIIQLSKKRLLQFWAACVMSLCAVVVIAASSSSVAGVAIAFAAIIQWVLTFKYESDLRLLKTIEGLRLG